MQPRGQVGAFVTGCVRTRKWESATTISCHRLSTIVPRCFDLREGGGGGHDEHMEASRKSNAVTGSVLRVITPVPYRRVDNGPRSQDSEGRVKVVRSGTYALAPLCIQHDYCWTKECYR